MGAAQVFLMIVLKVKEKCFDEPAKKDEDQKMLASALRITGCIQANCATVCTSIFPLFYLLYQEGAPYRQKPFEIALACYYWVADVTMQYQYQAVEEAVASGEGGKEDTDVTRTYAQKKSNVISKFANLCQMAFGIYTCVLAWMYWFSDDISETFDKVFTMITMVLSCLWVCVPPCLLLQCVLRRQVNDMTEGPEAVI